MVYSKNNKGYMCYNKFNKRIIDCIDVKVYVHDDQEVKELKKSSVDELVSIGDENDDIDSKESEEDLSSPYARYPPRYVQKHHLAVHIVGELNYGVQARRRLEDSLTRAHVAMFSIEEPNDIVQSSHEHWLKSMNE